MEQSIASATATTGKIKYRTTLLARKHSVIADEPEGAGGGDAGPKPGELLCMSLASCIAITIQMYAVRKQWDIGHITVKVTRIMKEKLTQFETEVSFEKDAEQEIKDRLYAVGQKCPVHKVLSNPIIINSKNY